MQTLNNYQRWRQAFWAGLILVLLIAIWTLLAPISLGGQAAYVIIDGASMEPRFHLGDLVVVRQARSYGAGDIVAYNNLELKRYVFHRITAMKGDHFVLRGDNNQWDDSYQPVQSEVVGEFWLQFPSLGKWVRWARVPANMGLMAGIVGGLIALSLVIRKRNYGKSNMAEKSIAEWFRHLREKGFRQLVVRSTESKDVRPVVESDGRTGDPSQPQNFKHWGAALEGLFFVLGSLAFASLILGFFAYTRPAQRTVANNIGYQHVGLFSYSATAPAGIYDTTSVQTGEPIFPKYTCIVNIRFSYALAGIQPEELAGSYQLSAKVLDENSGWQRTIPLTPQTPFIGNTFVVNTPVNLCQMEEMTASLEQTTDLYPPYYVLSIVPTVTLSGKVQGRDLSDTFAPPLDFRFNKVVFSVIHYDPKINPLNPSQAGVVQNARQEPNLLPILGMQFDVGRLRVLSALGLVISLIGLAIIGGFLSTLARQQQGALLQLKYGPLLAEARDRGLTTTSEVIDVASMDDLAKLAERNNTLILYQKRDLIHFYTVRSGKLTYRFAFSDGSDVWSGTPLIQLEEDLQKGLERGEFEVHYQPIMSLADGKIFGVEALLRWHHPQRGLVPAAEFIPAAEATGLINPLGDWLLQVACAQLKEWREAGHPLMLSVNFSERQLEGDLAGSILRVLQSTGMDPHALQIEIPDTGMMEQSRVIIPQLRNLKDQGVQISMDDSSGSSALSSFSQFPISSIKLDRPFVQRISDQAKAMSLQRVIEAARGRGLNVTAVGVETQEQLEFLQAQYCNFAQGYLLGRPSSAQELARSLLKSDQSVAKEEEK